MYILKINYEKCKRSYHCEDVLNGFKSSHGGIEKFIEAEDKDRLELARIAVRECEAEALNLTYYPD
jgi:hypothetical protein